MKAVIKLLRYTKRYKLFMILAPLLMAFEVTMDLIQPFILQLIIDHGIANEEMNYVVTMIILSIICAIGGLFGGVGCSIYSTKAAVHFACDVRKDLFKKVASFSSENRDQFSIGKLITNLISDVTIIQQALMMTLRVFVRGPLLFIGSVIIVFFQVQELFPILLVLIPILLFFIIIISQKSKIWFERVQNRLDLLNVRLQESIAGIRVIKAFVRSDYEVEQFHKVNHSLQDTQLVAERLVAILMPILLFFVNAGVVIALLLGVVNVGDSQVAIGKILAFINYLHIILMALMSSSNVLMQLMRAFPSASRIVDVLETENKMENRTNRKRVDTLHGDVTFRNVSFSYHKGEMKVLNNISFSINSGETLGIIGPTGSGKTTLIKLLARLYDPDEGEIIIDGMNIKEIDMKQLREHIGFITQKPFLFSGTIAENIRYGKKEAEMTELHLASQQARANEFIEQLSEKYDYELKQGATNLSGGQKQRLSIARTFIKKPAILILDDATSAVDAGTEKMILQALKANFEQSTKIIMSSKVSSIKHADKIIVVNNGQIVGCGTHEFLRQSCPLYEEIYETQVAQGGVIVE